jgi:hypothetical protein
MEPTNDPRLSELLREWNLQGAPPSLDARVAAFQKQWWSFLLAGSIRVPVPVGVVVVVILLLMAGALMRRQAVSTPSIGPAAQSIDLVNFRPVNDVNVRVIRGHEPN